MKPDLFAEAGIPDSQDYKMNWKEYMAAHPLSFRGIPFVFVSSSLSGGLQNQTNRYKDEWNTQTISVIPKEFQIEGKVLGQDYLLKKKRLEEALLAPSPGVLSHPLFGSLKVTPGKFFIKEKGDGKAEFNITFLKKENQTPTVRDLPEDLNKIKDNLISVLAEARKSVILKATGTGYKTLTGLSNYLSGGKGSLAETGYLIASSAEKVHSLREIPGDIVQRFSRAVDSVVKLYIRSKKPRKGFREFSDISLSGSPEEKVFLQGFFFLATGRILKKIDFASYEETIHYIKNWNQLARDIENNSTITPAILEVINTYKNAVIKEIREENKNLLREQFIRFSSALPLLRVSHIVRQTPEKILQMNSVPNSFFMSERILYA